MPDLSVPWLRKGMGDSPADGGCVMQIVDWIDRHGWSDAPACVHPVIRSLAVTVNDSLPDADRQLLLALIPRLMDTSTGGERLARRLLGWLARQVFPLFDTWASSTGYDDGGSVLACIVAAERGEAAEDARTARAARAAWAAKLAEAGSGYPAAWAAEAAWAASIAEVGWTAWAARAAWAANSPSLELLVGLLDRHAELTGRGAVNSVDLGPVCRMLAGAEAA